MGSWIVNVRASKQRGMGWRKEREKKAQEQRKGERVMAYCEYFRASCVLSVIAAFDSPLDVSVPTSKESRHQPFFPPLRYMCIGIASGIELGQIHYTVAMETKAQMLIKCVRACVFFFFSPNRLDETDCMHACHIPHRLTAKLPVCVFQCVCLP